MLHTATFGLGLAVGDGGVVRTVRRAASFAGAVSVVLEERPRAPAPTTRPPASFLVVCALAGLGPSSPLPRTARTISPAAPLGRGGHRIPPCAPQGRFPEVVQRGRRVAARQAASVRSPTTCASAASDDLAQSRNDERKPCDRVLPVLGVQTNIVQHTCGRCPTHVVAAAVETGADVGLGGRPAFEFLVLTAARSAEVRLATWATRWTRRAGCGRYRRIGLGFSLRASRMAESIRSPARLSSFTSTRSRVRVAVWRLGLALRRAGVAVERVSTSHWGQRSRRSSAARQAAGSRLRLRRTRT